jgi:hypothetical protein
VLAKDVDETFVQYRPLFCDETAQRGNWFYRIRATNKSGASEPSNSVGPVKVSHASFVDELASFERVHDRSGNWEIHTRDCRQAKEDAHRAAGGSGAVLTYALPSALEGFRVFAFFPSEIADLKFSVSTDGNAFQKVVANKQIYFEGSGDYGYWKPVEYHAGNLTAEARFLRIELSGETQIGRVEIHRAIQP